MTDWLDDAALESAWQELLHTNGGIMKTLRAAILAAIPEG
jgi:hypothetical protein